MEITVGECGSCVCVFVCVYVGGWVPDDSDSNGFFAPRNLRQQFPHRLVIHRRDILHVSRTMFDANTSQEQQSVPL